VKQMRAYKIDLSRIEGTGDFSCPRCGTKISPDDFQINAEKACSILELTANSHGLEELVVRCNKCFSYLYLSGLPFLQKMLEQTEEAPEGREKKEAFWYIARL